MAYVLIPADLFTDPMYSHINIVEEIFDVFDIDNAKRPFYESGEAVKGKLIVQRELVCPLTSQEIRAGEYVVYQVATMTDRNEQVIMVERSSGFSITFKTVNFYIFNN